MRKDINLSVLQRVGGLSLIRAAEMMARYEQTVSFPGLFFRTKIFIRFPKTLFATEDAFEFRKHLLGMAAVPFII